MRRFHILSSLILVSVCSSGFAQEAQDQPAAQSEPTLKESTDWLQAHLVGLNQRSKTTTTRVITKKKSKVEEQTDPAVFSYIVTGVRAEGCRLTVVEQTRFEMDSSSSVATQASILPLDRMTAASWEVTSKKPETARDGSRVEISPSAHITITVSGPPGSVQWNRRIVNIPADPSTDPGPSAGAESGLILVTDDGQIAPRLLNALNHTIKLCKANAKPEPF